MTTSKSIRTGGTKTETVIYLFLGMATLISLLNFFTALVNVSGQSTQIAGAIERWGTKPAQVMLAGGDTNRTKVPAAQSAATLPPSLTTGAAAPASGKGKDS